MRSICARSVAATSDCARGEATIATARAAIAYRRRGGCIRGVYIRPDYRFPDYPITRLRDSPIPRSVPVVLRLVRSLGRHADVGGLLGRELRQLHAKVIEMEPRDLFVEVLRQDVDLLLVLVVVLVQLQLRDHLVGERR